MKRNQSKTMLKSKLESDYNPLYQFSSIQIALFIVYKSLGLLTVLL